MDTYQVRSSIFCWTSQAETDFYSDNDFKSYSFSVKICFDQLLIPLRKESLSSYFPIEYL